MKKLIRVFIIVFCLFFVLQALPGSFLHIIRRYTLKIPEYISEGTLQLAESIDQLLGEDSGDSDPDADSQPSSDAAQDQPSDADKEKASDDQAEDPSGDSPLEETDEIRTGPAEDSSQQAEDSAESADPESGDAESGSSEQIRESEEDQDGSGENSRQPDITYYYYTKISKEERLLYDAMLSLAQNFGADPASESRLLDTNPSSDEFAESYTRAYNALVRDHPELFWIAQSKAQYECKYYLLPSFGGKFKVILSLSDTSGQEPVNEDGTTIYQEEEARMEAAADSLLDQVDFTQSDAGIALQLHDLLINSAWYNRDAGEYDYAHTAYGALVEDSTGNPGGALCDGYALAYEYLLQKAGITCIVVSGYAGASEGETEKHAWNLVRLDDDWYEVDATWDDLDFLLSPTEDGYDLFLEALSDEDYMSRIRHYMFNRTTEEMRSFTPGDEFTYVSHKGWVTLLRPSVHIRSTADESEISRDYVTPLAPDAEGTWYTWDMLTGHE